MDFGYYILVIFYGRSIVPISNYTFRFYYSFYVNSNKYESIIPAVIFEIYLGIAVEPILVIRGLMTLKLHIFASDLESLFNISGVRIINMRYSYNPGTNIHMEYEIVHPKAYNLKNISDGLFHYNFRSGILTNVYLEKKIISCYPSSNVGLSVNRIINALL